MYFTICDSNLPTVMFSRMRIGFSEILIILSHTIDQHGFALIPQVINDAYREELIAELGPVSGAGRRGLLALPIIAELARSTRLLELVRPHLPGEPIPVRVIYFDKSPDANWLVSWHQDLTIAVREQIELAGFGPWSIKDGIPHVQPPLRYLEEMLAVRLHLDDADEENGALRVLPGTQGLGKLSSQMIQDLRSQLREQVCTVAAGDVLMMRPLLLHASSRSTSTRHRRVLHIEYAGVKLPSCLKWHEAS